jgi:hypothetical protein
MHTNNIFAEPRNPKAVVYNRVSTLDQVSGVSLQVQEESGWRWFDANLVQLGIDRGEVLRDEGQSAMKIPLFQRENGRQLGDETFITAGDHIIFLRFDRAFRSLPDFVLTMKNFVDRGIICHFVHGGFDMGTATGRAMANMMVTLAALESEIKSERLLETFAYHREHQAHIPHGRNYQNIPGLKIVRTGGLPKFEKVLDEFDTYLFFLREAATGKHSINKLADMCDERMHNLRGIPYKKSAFRERLWGTASETWNYYAVQSFHQRSLKAIYGDRPEFHLPIPARFKHIRTKYEKKCEMRKRRVSQVFKPAPVSLNFQSSS